MKTKSEIYNITFKEKYLYLNCPKCKEIPFLCFNEKNPEKINLNCNRCNNKIEIDLNKYLTGLSQENLLKNKNCSIHNNFFDKYCYNCHTQFCSKCEIYNQHSSHIIKTIKKIITLETIEKAKEVLNYNKKYFKKYICDFYKEHINKIQKNKHYYITNDLVKPYINSMKNFFYFCDLILLNCDLEYPNYYQQCNLNKLLYFLKKESTLINLNEPKLERIFKYSNNNFIMKNTEIENNLISKELLDFSPDKISDAIIIDDEFIVIAFQNILNTLKIYNYKNKYLISIIENIFNDIEPSDIIKLKYINKDIFAVILYIEYYSSTIKIYSIYSKSYVLFDKNYDFHVNTIIKMSNCSFGITLRNYIEIYKSNKIFQDITEAIKAKNNITQKFEVTTKIKIPLLYDFIQTQNQLYVIALCLNRIIVYNSKDFSFYKEIKLSKEFEFESINEIEDSTIILAGKKIGIIDTNKWSYKILYDDNIPELKMSYLSGTKNIINYSNFVLTYFNKLICRRKFKQILQCHYDDVDDEVITDEKALCIFDFNPKINSVKLIQNNKHLKIENIYMKRNNEIIIFNENKIQILYID